MDRVRFGRALGFGTRQAFKTLASAMDAAAAENPSARPTSPSDTSRHSTVAAQFGSPPSTASRATPAPASSAPSPREPSGANRLAPTRQVKQRLGRGGKRFGEALWEPFVRLSGVLWLEVTGVFFGLFALVALGHLWKLRAAWQSNTTDVVSRHSLIGAALMFLLFGYFCATSFIRARRRERKR